MGEWLGMPTLTTKKQKVLYNCEDISTKMKVQPATMGIKTTKLVAWAIS